jgi:hypothetical protein
VAFKIVWHLEAASSCVLALRCVLRAGALDEAIRRDLASAPRLATPCNELAHFDRTPGKRSGILPSHHKDENS